MWLVELGLGLVVGLLDPRRVDAPVLQQLLERQPGDLAAHAVEAPRGRPRSGVSSMMKSTPVRFSSARMLRPSRPMIRPFMSSAGQLDDRDRGLGGVAARRAAASRPRGCCARAGRPRRLVSSSTWRRIRACSWRASSSTSCSSACLACAGAQAGDPLELAQRAASRGLRARAALVLDGGARGRRASAARRSRSAARWSSERSSAAARAPRARDEVAPRGALERLGGRGRGAGGRRGRAAAPRSAALPRRAPPPGRAPRSTSSMSMPSLRGRRGAARSDLVFERMTGRATEHGGGAAARASRAQVRLEVRGGLRHGVLGRAVMGRWSGAAECRNCAICWYFVALAARLFAARIVVPRDARSAAGRPRGSQRRARRPGPRRRRARAS